jgi:hypothetical protein
LAAPNAHATTAQRSQSAWDEASGPTNRWRKRRRGPHRARACAQRGRPLARRLRFVEQPIENRCQELLELAAVIKRQTVCALVSHRAALTRVDRPDGDVRVAVGIRRQLDGGTNPLGTVSIGVASMSACERAGRSGMRPSLPADAAGHGQNADRRVANRRAVSSNPGTFLAADRCSVSGSRVAGGVAAPGSLRSRRDSLPSPGSSDRP